MKIAATAMGLAMAVCMMGCASRGSTTPPPTVPPPLEQSLAGPASEVYPYSLSQTATATVSAMRRMGMAVTDRRPSNLGTHIEGMTQNNTRVFVDLVRLQYATQVSVTYGLYGDAAQGRRLLDYIPEFLPEK